METDEAETSKDKSSKENPSSRSTLPFIIIMSTLTVFALTEHQSYISESEKHEEALKHNEVYTGISIEDSFGPRKKYIYDFIQPFGEQYAGSMVDGEDVYDVFWKHPDGRRLAEDTKPGDIITVTGKAYYSNSSGSAKTIYANSISWDKK